MSDLTPEQAYLLGFKDGQAFIQDRIADSPEDESLIPDGTLLSPLTDTTATPEQKRMWDNFKVGDEIVMVNGLWIVDRAGVYYGVRYRCVRDTRDFSSVPNQGGLHRARFWEFVS